MKRVLPGNVKFFIIPLIAIGVASIVQEVNATTTSNVNVNSSTCKNTINGVTTDCNSSVKININGKEYVNDNNGGSYDIVDDSNGGKVEIHVNSNNTTSTKQQSTSEQKVEVNTNSRPTIDVEPTISKVKEDVEAKKKEAEKKKEEQKDFIEQLREKLDELFEKITSIF